VAEQPRLSALAQVLHAGRTGVLGSVAGLEVSEVRPSAMAQINGAVDGAELQQRLSAFALARAPAPLECALGPHARLLWNGPNRYLCIAESHAPAALVSMLREALRDLDCQCVDLSHASCVLRVHGPCARDVIAKGCSLDLELMHPHSCAPTAIGRFDVLVHCVGDDIFEIYVARSLAESFAHWLLRAGAEFGVKVGV
jgi:sarcosine oxidase subunit gamma